MLCTLSLSFAILCSVHSLIHHTVLCTLSHYSTDHAGIKCKIMRKVSYPESLDIIDLCNDALQSQLRLNREKEDKIQEEILVAKRAKIEAEFSSSAGSDNASASASGAMVTEEPSEGKVAGIDMEVDDDEDAEALRAALAMSVGAEVPPPAPVSASSTSPSPFGMGVPDTFNGMYELHSVVTHKGRSADSGHYIGWTRQAPNRWELYQLFIALMSIYILIRRISLLYYPSPSHPPLIPLY